jgi:hypothetical protein
MTVTSYPATLSPYPSPSPVAARRVDPREYPEWDGLVFKLGPQGCSVNPLRVA